MIKQMSWSKLTPEQQKQIKKEFEGWDETKLSKGLWTLHTHALRPGKSYTVWAADFGRTIKL